MPAPTPSPGRRLAAYVLDSIAGGVAGVIVALWIPSAGSLVSASYILLRDGIDLPGLGHRSFGKRVMGLRTERLDGGSIEVEVSMRRNWPLALHALVAAGVSYGWLPDGGLAAVLSVVASLLVLVEGYRVLTDPGGRRWGDVLAATRVVPE